MGLDEIADADKRLAAALKVAKVPRGRATDELKQLKRLVDESDDVRATEAAKLLKKRTADLAAVLALATGSNTTVSPSLTGLRALAELSVPQQSGVDSVVSALRSALASTVDLAEDALSIAGRCNDILDAALHLHEQTGTIDCPVCETGTLDDDWAERSRAKLATENETLAQFKQSRRDLANARRVAVDLVNEVTDATPVDDVDRTSTCGTGLCRVSITCLKGLLSRVCDAVNRAMNGVGLLPRGAPARLRRKSAASDCGG
ncbi:hypothetical protein [Rhodococcoides fascians]|uniref:hypothetical protein n=1 Tax=Rhodococcoides fascians TaxID=1828 RepID=UPI000689D227|nr:hypothetical protein [Rhodococcus fascians]